MHTSDQVQENLRGPDTPLKTHIDELVTQIERSLDALERERLLGVVNAVAEARGVPLGVAMDVVLQRDASSV